MKELSIEEKAKAYDRVSKEVKDFFEGRQKMPSDVSQTLEYLFPELKESEDERIKKDIIDIVKSQKEQQCHIDGSVYDKMIAWLEKQCEQEPTERQKPKFHEGEWIVQENIGVYKVVEVCESWYEVVNNKDEHYSVGFDKEYMCHLWTIADAKDGDVLKLGCVIAMFKKYISQEKCLCYCSISEDGEFEIPIENGEDNKYGCTNATPATKEQRDLLFKKMKEASYVLDNQKNKELLEELKSKFYWLFGNFD